MPGKAFLISLLFSFLLFPASIISEILHLSGIRPPFFLLQVNDPEERIAEPYVIYRANGTPAGEYDLLESSGTVLLCRCRDLSVDIGPGCYVNIHPAPVSFRKVSAKKKVRTKEEIRLRGIRFRRVEGGMYLTLNPVPLSIVRTVSREGVEGFVSRIGESGAVKFRVSLLSPEETVQSLEGSGRGPFLARRDGALVLVFIEPPENRENRVSEKIMKKLKYEVFIPLKAEAL